MSASHVAFLTEGGAGVGLGHVSRCLALADAAGARGARATFVVVPEPVVVDLLAGRALRVVAHPWTSDAVGGLELLRALQPDAIVVDSYQASPDLLAALRSVAAPVVAVDDTAERALPVDVVVNGGVAAESLPYQRIATTEWLLGPRYALLDPAWADAPVRRPAARVARIVVTLGGGLSPDATAAAVAAADSAFEAGIIDVAAGPFGAPDDALDGLARRARNRVVIHRGRFGLRPLMQQADLAVCGAGMTLYELAAAGTPAITVCMADNQRPNTEAFARHGAALSAGHAGDPALRDSIAEALSRLVADAAARAEMASRARQLVDGRGAMRVAEHVARAALARS